MEDAHGERLAEAAEQALFAAEPFADLDPGGLFPALQRVLLGLGLRPHVLARESARLSAELVKISLGRSRVAPGPKDKRFADATWRDNPAYRRLGQTYLAWADSMQRLVDAAELDPAEAARAHYGVTLITAALSPANVLVSNPAALKRAFETAGLSLLRGARHLLSDLRHNRGMPAQVNRDAFTVGEDIAASPGAVVFRNPVLEVLQYAPRTDQVRERPVLLVPHQINKYYVMDMAPGRSLVEYTTGRGVPFFAVSWRNPTAKHRDWGMDTYVNALLEATDAVREITGSEDLNLLGTCAGGMTGAVLLGHLAAIGDRRVRAATFVVTFLDTSTPSMVGMFSSPAAVLSAVERSQREGVLAGRDTARLFAWLRPDDLVWNYWVNNYLLGEEPPAFDILYWNNDTTNLPARLHADFLDLFQHAKLRTPGALEVLGTPIDLSKVEQDVYVAAGITDHITPWRACYQTTQLLGGATEFVLNNSGHVKTLVCPPDDPKASYYVATGTPSDPEVWYKAAEQRRGSWWDHWAEWLLARSGAERPVPSHLGSARHPPLEPAPGRYIHQR